MVFAEVFKSATMWIAGAGPTEPPGTTIAGGAAASQKWQYFLCDMVPPVGMLAVPKCKCWPQRRLLVWLFVQHGVRSSDSYATCTTTYTSLHNHVVIHMNHTQVN